MNYIVTLFLLFSLTACSENAQNVQSTKVEKDYLEKYYEAEEVRYENYLKTMAD